MFLILFKIMIQVQELSVCFCCARFKIILGYLQLDNQLPLSLMPVLLAPEQTADIHHPVFKMTITKHNENTDGIQVYPYVYIRVKLISILLELYSVLCLHNTCSH